MPRQIAKFTKGRRTKKGEPLPADAQPRPFPAVVLTRDEVDLFFGVRSRQERVQWVRALRDRGLVVHDNGKLTNTVRLPDGRRIKAYVFRAERASDVPRPSADWLRECRKRGEPERGRMRDILEA